MKNKIAKGPNTLVISWTFKIFIIPILAKTTATIVNPSVIKLNSNFFSAKLLPSFRFSCLI